MTQKTYIGFDFAIKPKWWQKVLSWFGFKKYRSDLSCAVLWEEKDKVRIIKDIKYF